MAHPSYGRWREENNSLLQEGKLPENEDLGTEIFKKLCEAASWMSDLFDLGEGGGT